MFKQEIVNEYASRIYGDMRGMNVPYRIIQHYFCGQYVYICIAPLFISIPPRSEHLNRSEGFSQNKTP